MKSHLSHRKGLEFRRTHHSSRKANPKHNSIQCQAKTGLTRAICSSGEYEIQEVGVSDDAAIRATSYLRAAAFFTYPSGRSEMAARSHRRMKADDEWESLEARMKGRDKLWSGVRVTPIIAVLPYDPTDPVSQALDQELDRSTKLPGVGAAPPKIVVATLDVNIGRGIPSEELLGSKPAEAEGSLDLLRAYFANVCTAPSLRRQGLAASLLQYGERVALRQGARYMYVHVIASNTPALELYTKRGGYSVEEAETEAFARALDRPRRLLLFKDLALREAAS